MADGWVMAVLMGPKSASMPSAKKSQFVASLGNKSKLISKRPFLLLLSPQKYSCTTDNE